MELEELQNAVLRSQQAQQKLAPLDQQMQAAQALRGAPAPQIDPVSNTVSPLAVLANVVNKSRGRMESRDLQQQQAPLQEQVAEGTAALQNTQLRMSMAKEKRAEEAHALTMDTGKGSAENWTNGSQKVAVIRDAQNRPIVANGPMKGQTPPPDFYVDDELSARGGGGGRQAQKAVSSKDLDKWVTYGNQVRKTGEIVGRYKPQYAQPAGIPTKVFNKLLRTASRADLLSYMANEKVDTNTKEALQWWADWKMVYELPQRHEYFGATLTNNEVASWDDALHMVLGMDPAEVGKRMAKLSGDLKGDFSNRMKSQHTRAGRAQDRAAIEGVFGNAGGIITDGEFTFAQPVEPEQPEEISPVADYQAIYSTLSPEIISRIEGIPDPEVKKRVLKRLSEEALK